MILLLVFLVILSALFDGLADSCISESEYERGLLSYLGFNKNYFVRELSWKNKWKDGDKEKGERFFGSSTFLVWLTDGWHLLKFLRNRSIQLCISILITAHYSYNIWFVFVCIGILYGISFELFYSKLRQWIKK